MSERFLTPKGRVAFANVFKAVANEDGGEPKYSLSLIFDSEARADKNYKRMQALAKKTFIEKFGQEVWDKKSGGKGWPRGFNNPFRNGDDKEDYEGFAGNTFVTLSSKFAPGIVDSNVVKIISDENFYSGCYAHCTITCYAYDAKGNKGVSFGLNNIQKLADGERFGGSAPKAEDEFESFGGDDFGDDEDFDDLD